MTVPMGLKGAIAKARELLETPAPFREWVEYQKEHGLTLGYACSGGECPIATFIQVHVVDLYPTIAVSVGRGSVTLLDGEGDDWWEPDDDARLTFNLESWVSEFIAQLDTRMIGLPRELRRVDADIAMRVLDRVAPVEE